ncbi:hypothetical protein TRAPUB_9282 [Trametes pubescens]|uniref:Uncharacterized protein n=1 Tax=Trametes pubescens TaxID=154538 RepID=A0A1M2W2U5_TRAPU|nr:hypothetical protein TRAPUB_9282 [Trametes pubescens]
MVRRSPPTPLRLYNGPLPTRGQPKHTLPSLPCPAFCGPAPHSFATATPGPVPRARMVHTELPQLHIPDLAIPGLFSAAYSDTGSMPGSPTSAASSVSSLSGGLGGARKRSREFVRGPWDHSGAIRVPFDVSTVLAPLRPAAINVR